MTLSAAEPIAVYTGNNTTTEFPLPYITFEESHVKVTRLVISTDVESVVSDSEYSITGINDAGGPTVVFTTPPTTDHQITVERVLPLSQIADYLANQGFPADDHEKQMDRAMQILQQQQISLNRTMKIRVSDYDNIDLVLPSPTANKILGWNSAGTGIENKTLTVTETEYAGDISYGADASKAASPSSGDLYFATDTNIFYKCAVAGTWSQNLIGIFDGVKGDDIASASSVDLGAATGNYVDITGTTGITALGTASAGIKRTTQFDGALTLTHNASSLILPGAADITTESGDVAEWVSLGSGNWKCLFYQRASGYPIIELPDHYREGGDSTRTGTEALSVAPFVLEIGGKRVVTTSATAIDISAAGSWANASSQQGTSTHAYIGVDIDGNVKVQTTAPTHSNYGLTVTAGYKRYVSWNSTTYRVIARFYMNGTGSGEVDTYGCSNFKEFGMENTMTRNGQTADTINDTSYGTDLTEVTIPFYTNGGIMDFDFFGDLDSNSDSNQDTHFVVDISGTDKTASERRASAVNTANKYGPIALRWSEKLAAGAYIATVQAKVGAGSKIVDQKVFTITER